MDQALAVLDELSSRVHSLFTDALEGSRVLSALREFAAAVEWKVNSFFGRVFFLQSCFPSSSSRSLVARRPQPPPLSLLPFSSPKRQQEPLVLTIIASHVLLLALAVTTRGNQAVQLSVLLFCFGLVRGGERLNALAARKFEEFFPASSSSLPRRTNYFAGDKGGVFWSALVSAPLLLVMAVQLVSFLFVSLSRLSLSLFLFLFLLLNEKDKIKNISLSLFAGPLSPPVVAPDDRPQSRAAEGGGEAKARGSSGK
jgi:hypothetical protein